MNYAIINELIDEFYDPYDTDCSTSNSVRRLSSILLILKLKELGIEVPNIQQQKLDYEAHEKYCLYNNNEVMTESFFAFLKYYGWNRISSLSHSNSDPGDIFDIDDYPEWMQPTIADVLGVLCSEYYEDDTIDLDEESFITQDIGLHIFHNTKYDCLLNNRDLLTAEDQTRFYNYSMQLTFLAGSGSTFSEVYHEGKMYFLNFEGTPEDGNGYRVYVDFLKYLDFNLVSLVPAFDAFMDEMFKKYNIKFEEDYSIIV